jgi:hypothetical protein
MAAFECRIEGDDRQLAKANLTVYEVNEV